MLPSKNTFTAFVLAAIFLFANPANSQTTETADTPENSTTDVSTTEVSAAVEAKPTYDPSSPDVDGILLRNLKISNNHAVFYYLKTKYKSAEKFVDIYWERFDRDGYAAAQGDSFKMKDERPAKIKEYNAYMKNLTDDVVFSHEGKFENYDQNKKSFPMTDFENNGDLTTRVDSSPFTTAQLKSNFAEYFNVKSLRKFPSTYPLPEDKAKVLNSTLADRNVRRGVTAVSFGKIKKFDDSSFKNLKISKLVVDVKKVIFYVWNKETSKYDKLGEVYPK